MKKNMRRRLRRHRDYYKAKRKARHLPYTMGIDIDDITPVQFGMLKKGKPYCSCWMCNGYEKWEHSSTRIKWEEKEKQLRKEYEEGDYE